MIDTLFHIANDFFFFCIILSGIYLFIFALIALFRHSGKYPATEKKYRFALLVPLQTHIEDLKYPKELYTVITYNDPVLAVRELDENQYDIAVILGETTHVSPLLLQDINDAYDAGVMAMQLHHIIEHRPTGKIRRKAIREEIRNSIYRQGHVQAGLSSALEKTDIAIDAKWLKQNLKSPKSNLESRLLMQNIFIEYLHYAHVYSDSPRPLPYSMVQMEGTIQTSGNTACRKLGLCRQTVPTIGSLLESLVLDLQHLVHHRHMLRLDSLFKMVVLIIRPTVYPMPGHPRLLDRKEKEITLKSSMI